MIFCLALLGAACALGALATSFEMLFVSRILVGIAAGGTFPVAMGLASDLVPTAQRQVALGRVLAGAMTGAYMIRHGQYKYIHYAGLPPMLFDLAADPHERSDLGRAPASAAIVRECEAALRAMVDPDAVDRLAREIAPRHG